MHVDCAARVLVGESTQVVTTAGFEFVRPAKEDADRRPTFEPNSLSDRVVASSRSRLGGGRSG